MKNANRHTFGAALVALGAAWLAGNASAQDSAPRAVAKPVKSGAATATTPQLPPSVALQNSEQHELVLPGGVARIAIADPTVADALVLKANGKNAHGSLLVTGKRPGQTNMLVWFKGQAQASSVELTVAASANASPAAAVLPPAALSGSVQVDVKIVEFSKTALKQMGLNFGVSRDNQFRFGTFAPSSLNSASFTPGGISAEASSPISSAFNLLGLSGSINAHLSILQGNGMARVLAEPALVAQSGHSASFLSGGELPIPVAQGLGNVTIQYKPFGIGLAVTPTVLGADRIALKVAPEASDLDFSNAITVSGTSVPVILTRRADTTVELGDGETFVIGGLVGKNTISNVNKVPLLGDLPVLGTFFKTLNYRSEEKELVIMVTPRLVRPIARDARLTLPGEGRENPDGAAWLPHVTGALIGDSLPGFSK